MNDKVGEVSKREIGSQEEKKPLLTSYYYFSPLFLSRHTWERTALHSEMSISFAGSWEARGDNIEDAQLKKSRESSH